MRVALSERGRGSQPRTVERLDEETWGGLVLLVDTRVEGASFEAAGKARRSADPAYRVPVGRVG